MKHGNNSVISALISARDFVYLQDLIDSIKGISISSFVGGVVSAILSLPEESIRKLINSSDKEKRLILKKALD